MSTPRFLADEDLRLEIVLAARRLEPALEFTLAREAGCQGFTDAQLLDFAKAADWLVISHDVNTMRGVAESKISGGQETSGLFLVPQSRPTRTVVDSVVLIWSASEAEEWRNRIVYLPL